MDLRYIANGSSLVLDAEKCIGCGRCVEDCPHAVFAMRGAAAENGVGKGRAAVAVRGRCMECGACARNCPASAIAVKAGVGCAAAIIGSLIGKPGACGCGQGTCCC